MGTLSDGAVRRQLEGTPRDRVRYVYLLEVWPAAAACASCDHALLEAPADAVMAALVMEIDKYSKVIDTEREARKVAQKELAALRSAGRTISELFRVDL